MSSLEKEELIPLLNKLTNDLNFKLILSMASAYENQILWVESITLVDISYPKSKRKCFIHKFLQFLKFRKERRK